MRLRPADSPAAVQLLEVEGLNAFYGSAQALENVSFRMGSESVAIVGRNGMGKTTLCNALVGLSPPSANGSVRFRGQELIGAKSHKIARYGIGYVPQGRRLFPSLTVDEHLQDRAARIGDRRRLRWTIERVYDLFPRLAERKRNGGAQLSGGEQQMLAIGRALVTNPQAADHGRAVRRARAGDHREPDRGVPRSSRRKGSRILLIEQNLGVATSLAERQLVMVARPDRARDDGRRALRRPRDAAPVPRRRAARPLDGTAARNRPPKPVRVGLALSRLSAARSFSPWPPPGAAVARAPRRISSS